MSVLGNQLAETNYRIFVGCHALIGVEFTAGNNAERRETQSDPPATGKKGG